MAEQFDYIIAGSGCAGLSLALELAKSSLPFQRVLIIDKETKSSNDRTWCYWSKADEDWFPDLNYRTWNEMLFKSDALHCEMALDGLSYRMIRSADFYKHCQSTLKNDARFTVVTSPIISLESLAEKARIRTEAGDFEAPFIFNSAVRSVEKKIHHVNFVQHFKGWIIETDNAVFNPARATFMDFSIQQEGDCRFVYVLPFSEKEALVEYTGFSPQAITDEAYDRELTAYIKTHLKTEKFQIKEMEQGVIPMYQSLFINPYGPRVINIGTAGGASKASTGFTFYFIQLQVRALASQLKGGMWPNPVKNKKGRFHWYDSVLLQVLNSQEISGAEIFTQLFKRNRASEILDFLNEKTSIYRELRIMSTLPFRPFLKAARRVLF